MNHADGVERVPSRWIISPLADLALLICAPLAIVPIVSWLVHTRYTAEQISLAVVSFATIGHHLPGFLRAYGDHALFARFRWRFLLAPPLALAIAIAFAVSNRHGLSLVLLIWATWHVLMQTYGLMRIYDLKNCGGSSVDAKLDFALCLAMFSAGMVFSDARVLAIVETMWRSGVPVTGPEWLIAVRWIVGLAALTVLTAYLARQIMLAARGTMPSVVKLLLAISTGWIYWFTGTLAVDMLVGVAMFEIFHAIQYDTVVWAYNRRLANRSQGSLGCVGSLFADRWSSVGMYLAAILAFGMLRFFGGAITQPVVSEFLFAGLAASTLLHFYFDGFIWQVSERSTNVNLNITDSRDSAPQWGQSPFDHLLRWAFLLVVLGGLYALEGRTIAFSPADDRQMLADLARWMPNLPEVQLRLARAALDRGDNTVALAAATLAVEHRPKSSQAQADLGLALMRTGRYVDAANAFTTATQLSPKVWQNFVDLGAVQSELALWDAAGKSFARAADLAPTEAAVETGWSNLCARHGEGAQAIMHRRAALAIEPNNLTLRTALVEALSAAADHHGAVAEAEQGVARAPQSAAAHVSLAAALLAAGQIRESLVPLGEAKRLDPNSPLVLSEWGIACFALGEYAAAQKAFDRALQLDGDFAPAHFQLGNLRLANHDPGRAVLSYRRCVALAPSFAEGYANLGVALNQQRQFTLAVEAFEQAIRLEPNRAAAHYNLGLTLLEQGDRERARGEIERARTLGQPPTAELAESLDL